MPPPYPTSIVGQFLVGDGHVVGGQPVAGPGGVPSAQAFGAVTTKTTVTRTVAGVGSAQSFGTITPKTTITRTVTGLGSAQAFGTVVPKASITKLVGGVSSAQAFTTPIIVPKTTVPVSGKTSAQSFGVPTIKTARTVAVTGVPSAQAFGAISVGGVSAVAVTGVLSAQAFGVPTMEAQDLGQAVSVAGLDTAQAFGQIAVSVAQVVEMGGIDSAQAFGQPTFEPPFLLPSDCLLVDLDPSQTVEMAVAPDVCVHDEPLLLCGTFLCGERILPVSFITPSVPLTLSIAASDTSTFVLDPSGATTFALEPATEHPVSLGPAFTGRVDVEADDGDLLLEDGSGLLLEVEMVSLAAGSCVGDEPSLICNTFLCGERILPRKFLSPSPTAVILHLDPADAVTLELEPAEVS